MVCQKYSSGCLVCLKKLMYRGFSSKKRKAYSVHSLESVKNADPLTGMSPSGTLRFIPTFLSSSDGTTHHLPAKYRYQFLYLSLSCFFLRLFELPKKCAMKDV